jgi:hypothetical protein
VDLAERPQDPVEESGRLTGGQTVGEFPERDIQKLLDHLRADGASFRFNRFDDERFRPFLFAGLRIVKRIHKDIRVKEKGLTHDCGALWFISSRVNFRPGRT